MSERLIDAVREGVREMAGSSATVLRVDVSKAGEVFVELKETGSVGWWRWADGSLERLDPARDEALPLAGTSRLPVIAWRPGRRIVLGRAGSDTVQKGWRRGHDRRAVRAHRVARASASPDSFRLAEIESEQPATSSATFERLTGHPFDVAKATPAIAADVGRRLREFQTAKVEDKLPRHGPAEELAVLEVMASRYRVLFGEVPAEFVETLGQVVERVGSLTEDEAVLCHGDLHEGQLLLDRGAVALLDIDQLCMGDAARDPANLVCHFALRERLGVAGTNEDEVLALADALLHGLGHDSAPSFWQRLRWYQATTFLRLALLYRMWTNDEGLMRDLLGLGSRSLGMRSGV